MSCCVVAPSFTVDGYNQGAPHIPARANLAGLPTVDKYVR